MTASERVVYSTFPCSSFIDGYSQQRPYAASTSLQICSEENLERVARVRGSMCVYRMASPTVRVVRA